MKRLRQAIEARLGREGPGWVFTRKDLRDIAPSGPIGVILARLTNADRIRRIGRGLYEYPRAGRLIKEPLPPDFERVVKAIARKHRWTIVPEGAMAANLLGLSQQVPAKIVYLSDGPSRSFKIGSQTIRFRHASPKDLRMEHYSSRLIAQALRFLGRRHVDNRLIRKLRKKLSRQDRLRFLRDARYGTDWILDVAQELAGKEPHG